MPIRLPGVSFDATSAAGKVVSFPFFPTFSFPRSPVCESHVFFNSRSAQPHLATCWQQRVLRRGTGDTLKRNRLDENEKKTQAAHGGQRDSAARIMVCLALRPLRVLQVLRASAPDAGNAARCPCRCPVSVRASGPTPARAPAMSSLPRAPGQDRAWRIGNRAAATRSGLACSTGGGRIRFKPGSIKEIQAEVKYVL